MMTELYASYLAYHVRSRFNEVKMSLKEFVRGASTLNKVARARTLLVEFLFDEFTARFLS